mgnify:FL=1
MTSKRIFFGVIFLCLNAHVSGQTTLKTFVFQISDSLSNKKLEQVSVLIVNSQKKIITQGLSDRNGICALKVGNYVSYKAIVSFPAYTTDYLDLKNIFQDSIKISLSKKMHTLEEVTIVSKKARIEDLGDRIVYHAGQDASTGGDASELLRKIPLVSVDMNGRPSIKANSNIKILVNGRPVANSDPSLTLKMIPAAQVSKIEVITSPPAKYESEGTAGIINIITAKKIDLGASGMFNGGVGFKSNDLVGSLSFAKKKVTLSASTGNYWGYSKTDGFKNFNKSDNQAINNIYNETQTGDFKIDAHYHQLSTGIHFDEKNSLIIDLTHSDYGMHTAVNSQSELMNTINGTLIKQNTTYEPSSFNGISANYQHTFKDAKQELNVKITYGLNNNQPLYDFNQTDRTLLNANYLFQDHNYNRELNSQIDFQFPSVNHKHLFEVGANGIYRQMGSTSTASTSSATGDALFPTTIQFKYNQFIGSLFTSSTFKISNRFSARSGLRFEGVANMAETMSQNYANLFPNMGITFSPSSTQSLSFNFNYRIQRPSIQFLNPTTNQSDQIIAYSGNPILLPEYTQNYELSFGTYIDKNYLKTSIYQSITKNSIHSFIIPTKNTLISSYSNVGTQLVSGMNIWATINVSDHLSINTNLDLNYSTIHADSYALNNQGLNFKSSFNLAYQLNKSCSVQYLGFYSSAKIRLQGSEKSYTYSNISVKKDFQNKKYSLALEIDNPFRSSFEYEIKNDLQNEYRYNNVTQYYDRGIRIAFSYKFGNTINKPTVKKQDSDLKNMDNGRQGIN